MAFEKYSYSGMALMLGPLYAGPVLAGWIAAPLWLCALLVLVFFAMQWLRGKLNHPALSVAAMIAIGLVVQSLLVGVGYGLGTLLAFLSGTLALPLWSPLLLSGMGGAIGVWRYDDPREEEMFQQLDKALASIEAATPLHGDTGDKPPHPSETPEVHAAAREAQEALWALAEEAGLDQIDPVISRLHALTQDRAYRHMVFDADGAPTRVVMALLRYIGMPGVLKELETAGELDDLHPVVLLQTDREVLDEYAYILETLLRMDAGVWNLPHPDMLSPRVAFCPTLADVAPRVAQRWEHAPEWLLRENDPD